MPAVEPVQALDVCVVRERKNAEAIPAAAVEFPDDLLHKLPRGINAFQAVLIGKKRVFLCRCQGGF